MNPAVAVVWVFVVIFVLTALIALASLPGWIRIGEYYKRKLFQLLILEVVACMVGFGSQALRSSSAPPQDLRLVLLAPELGWDWQYAEKAWRARLRFEPNTGRKLTLVGETYLVGRGDSRPLALIRWESTEPFEVPTGAKAVTFKAYRTWTQAAADVDPNLRWEVGKKTEVLITVRPEQALNGAVKDGTSAPWGLMMTPGFPR